VKKNIKEIKAIFNRSGLTANIEIKELNNMLELHGGGLPCINFMFINNKYSYVIPKKSSNLFLSFSLICEVCNVHCKCFLKVLYRI
jgi:hypothetical protein